MLWAPGIKLPPRTALRELSREQHTESCRESDVTSLAEHKIDVGQNAPTKQRYYLISPKVQEAIGEEVIRC